MDHDPYSSEWRHQHQLRLQPHLEHAHQRCIAAADRFARRFLPMVLAMQRHGLGLRAIAVEMNDRGYTARCGGPWTDQTVRQVLKRRRNLLNTEMMDTVRFIGWNHPGDDQRILPKVTRRK